MSLFQNSVLNKYIRGLDTEKVDEAYKKFIKHFHNPEVQENIRNSKEEQYQGGFLIDLFVNVLGYIKNPTPAFNITTELRNVKDAKKTDGAILDGEKVLAVIELKGTSTTDLSKVEAQAFGYMNNQLGCNYVITSNFEKLRFYIDNAVDFEEFNLFEMTKERFNIFWLCLSADYLLRDMPKKIKNESISQEENITVQLYKDYAAFRSDIFDSIQKENPEYDKLTLFKKTQKLLDRFLFIFFAEDRLLLPPNSIRSIVNQWKDLRDKYDEYFPLYDRFNKFFGYMNTGHKGHHHEIFAYNGGLFAPDEILDNIKIDDDILYKHTVNLSNYNYESEVDVNILGHIFEHSLNEIESIQSEIKGESVDKSKTKRKQDGVFYTPKYITKYIVKNTVGKLCEEKKLELDIQEEEYDKERKGRRIDTLKQLIQKLEDYREWLLQMTICDPACGSGAFLNQALEFLIAEHRYIDELKAKLLDVPMVWSEVENSILENNLYGVDINEESVEIAKLSLWLRTAQKGRALTSLNDNIKCGNSLIDDPDVAGDKAFNWQSEFPEVFANGGFDVVIGNPPYLRVQGLRDSFEIETKFYEVIYKSATGRFDIYVLFIEKSFELINNAGKISFILPHKFMVSDFGEGIRKLLIENKAVEEITHFGAEMVFADASTYTCILSLSRNNNLIKYKKLKPSELLFRFQFEDIHYDTLSSNNWNLQSQSKYKLFEKLKKQPQTVKSVFENISQGIVSVGDDIFLMKGEIKGDKFIGYSDKINETITIESETVKPILKGEDVKKYAPIKNTYFCFYPHIEKDGKTIPYEEDFFKENYPLAYNYMLPFKDELIAKKIRYKTNPRAWYSLHRSRDISLFEQEKIITPEISLGTNMTLDTDNLYHNTKCYTLAKRFDIKEDYRFWLAILNSKLLWFFLKNTGYVLRGGFFTFKTKYLEPFPLPKLNHIEDQNPIIEKVNHSFIKTESFENLLTQFLHFIQSKFEIEKPTTKLQKWNELEFIDLLMEFKKIKVKLSLSEEAEWMHYFKEQKEKAQSLKADIDRTNNEIDQLVYQLYGLTDDEIEIVEEGNV